MPDPLDADLRRRVQTAIDAELAHQRQVLAEVGPDVEDLLAPITALLRGGKRLRAAFLYWGWRAAGRPDDDGAVRMAAAMELFQAAALVHDDVMDDSDTRRGLPATHRALASEHDERGWQGDAARFGQAGAILAGNLCLTWADAMFAGCGLDPDDVTRARPLFDRMRTQLMAGQYIDVVGSARPWADLGAEERIGRARHVIRYKSAKYSIEQPLLIGATAGGTDEADLAALSAYGLALGEAFQLRDDLLGVFGDPHATGKPAGDDLREGKRTVLVARGLACADAAGAASLEARLGDRLLADGDVEDLRAVLTDAGAVTAVERDIASLADTARAALGRAAAVDPDARAALGSLVDITTTRTT